MGFYSENFELNFKVLTRIGLWDFRTRNLTKRQIYFFYQSFVLLFIALFNILEYIDLYVVRGDLEKFNYNLCSSVTTTVSFIRTLRNLYILPEINKLRNDLYKDAENETDQECRAILLKAAKEIKFLNRLFYGMAYSLISCWLSAPLLDYRSGARKLPFRQWFPFDIQSTPNYEFAYIYQVLSCFLMTSNIVATDLSTFGYLIQISAEYNVLEKILRKLNAVYEKEYEIDKEKLEMKKLSNEEETSKIIRNAVYHHQQIISRIKKFEDNFQVSVFLQIVGVTILLAIIGVDVTVMSTELNTKFITQLGYLSVALTDLFFYCLYGTRIQYKSYQIVDTVFNTPWYLMNSRFRPYLSLIILRAQNPPLITAGNLLYINFNVFLKVLRTTYNMLALFRQVASKNKIESL